MTYTLIWERPASEGLKRLREIDGTTVTIKILMVGRTAA